MHLLNFISVLRFYLQLHRKIYFAAKYKLSTDYSLVLLLRLFNDIIAIDSTYAQNTSDCNLSEHAVLK